MIFLFALASVLFHPNILFASSTNNINHSNPCNDNLEHSISTVLNFHEQTKDEHLNKLKDLVKLPSISFDGFPKNELSSTAIKVAELLQNTGLENVEVLKIDGAHPYVYADWLHAPGKPTILLYAHYDVQPSGNESLWLSKPFEATERNGRLYGRGTADDKAGIVVHTAAVASYLQTLGKLPLNVKFIIEGEEEIGSPHLLQFLKTYKDKLQADCMILTDCQNYDTGLPAITVSLRGLISFDIEIKALNSMIHSGIWGGPIPDPTTALTKILASMTDSNGRLSIPGIWDEVQTLTEVEHKQFQELPYDEAEFKKQAGLIEGATLLPSSNGTSHPLKQTWREPSFVVNAFEANSRNAGNVINASAWARFGIRIVANMDPLRTIKLVENYIQKNTPWGLKVSLEYDYTGKAWSTQAKGPAFEAALKALELGFKQKPVLIGTGGSISFVGPFSSTFDNIPVLLLGIEDPYTAAHSENESLHIEDFHKAVRSAIYFYHILAKSSD